MIEVKEILPLIVPPVGDGPEILFLEILELSKNIAETGEQSLYFQLGIRSNKDKLKGMVRKYEEYRRMINRDNLEFFLLRLIAAREETQRAKEKCRKHPSVPNLLALSACKGNAMEFQMLYHAKRKFTTLPALPGDTSVSGYESWPV